MKDEKKMLHFKEREMFEKDDIDHHNNNNEEKIQHIFMKYKFDVLNWPHHVHDDTKHVFASSSSLSSSLSSPSKPSIFYVKIFTITLND